MAYPATFSARSIPLMMRRADVNCTFVAGPFAGRYDILLTAEHEAIERLYFARLERLISRQMDMVA